jgi:hypothetical protein
LVLSDPAAKAGDFSKAAKLLLEAVFQLLPGEFDSWPGIGRRGCSKTLGLSRCCSQLRRLQPSQCAMLKEFTPATLVMRGEKTRAFSR